MSTPADQLMMEIAQLRVAGRDAEAAAKLEQLKRDYPRANSPLTEAVLQRMMNHLRH